MMCRRCGKGCANRTEGRRVMLAGEDLFFCNCCSPHAVAGSGGVEQKSIRGVPGAAPQTGELAAPPFGR
jgi:hypothetical protein